MAEPVTPSLIIGPALALGLIIGVYEAIVVHRDIQAGMPGRLGHTIHALILSIIFVFCTMNTPYVLKLIPALTQIPILGTALGIQIAIGLIAAIKIHAVSRIISKGTTSGGLGETWFHSIFIGALIVAAPYAYPFVKPLLPAWLLF